ncbi:NAD(P)-binding protein [Tuber magnatum]|uniref:NAD(P)-binding protein n=1 Tax=Tuber magnatum TaxID=42249 RepID=A0A317SX57_9PEZI|nr:NAD(P)-binding protein [Tuber magnatum]
MFRAASLLRGARALPRARNAIATPGPTVRQVSTTRPPRKDHDETKPGRFARTDPSITVECPAGGDVPSSKPVQRHRRTLKSFSLEGKVAVVTGGARGLGYVMTQALVESGADAAIVDLDGEEAVKSAKSLLEHFKGENPDAERLPTITAHTSDVSSPTSVRSTISEILAQHNSHIDVLVTSAGFTENFKAEDYPHDRMQKLWGVNVDGTYFCAVEAAKHMIERKRPGSMVFIGSMSGSIVNVPQPQAPYNAAKAAVRHLASSLAVEWAPHGIRVNCISPGYMLTTLTRKILDDNPELKAKWTSLIPQGRMGNPEDLMGAVVFLASGASSYVTGADLRIDGGYTVT